MTRNLQARDNFEKGDVGSATGHEVSRTTQPHAPAGSYRVIALQDVKAGTNGWFEYQDQSSPRWRAEALSRGQARAQTQPVAHEAARDSKIARVRTK